MKYDISDVIKMVKLNNPLMGTEIALFHSTGNSIFKIMVKLNNPLMGTENVTLILVT